LSIPHDKSTNHRGAQTIEPLEMTSEAPWDPSKVSKHQLLWEEEERKALIGNVKIDQHTISRERLEEPQLKMDESEFDILLSSCSAVYSEKTLIQRLVASVRVTSCYSGQEEANSVDKINRKVSAINNRARHKALSVEEVSRKFGTAFILVLETALLVVSRGRLRRPKVTTRLRAFGNCYPQRKEYRQLTRYQRTCSVVFDFVALVFDTLVVGSSNKALVVGSSNKPIVEACHCGKT
jgi:hypothetical protein